MFNVNRGKQITFLHQNWMRLQWHVTLHFMSFCICCHKQFDEKRSKTERLTIILANSPWKEWKEALQVGRFILNSQAIKIGKNDSLL